MMMFRIATIPRLILTLALALWPVFMSRAQGQGQRGEQEPQRPEVIKVNTALVTVPVIVTDRYGRFVTGLSQNDFRVHENGEPQQKDIWPNYISCCLVVHEDLIKEQPEVVKDLVRGINESGEWVERNRESAATLVSPYFRQDTKLLKYVLTQPPDRVTYRNLNPTDAEMIKIMEMGKSLGFLNQETPLSELIDRRYIPAEIKPAEIDLKRMPEVIKQDKAN
jgi:hypothetical protein